jgi:hypothetical protein
MAKPVEDIDGAELTELEEKALSALEGAFGKRDIEPAGVGDVELDNLGKLLQHGATEGLNLRGAVGQRFSRSDTGATSPLYKAMNRADKEAFRKQWCGTELDEHKELLRDKEKVNTKTKLTKMTYVSGTALIKREGITAFERYAKKCAALGAPWIEWDGMWDRYVYAEATKEMQERYDQVWRLKSRDNGPTDAPPLKDNADTDNAAAVTPAAKRKRICSKTPKEKAVAATKAPSAPGKGIGKGTTQKAMTEDDKTCTTTATKLRSRIQTGLGSAKHLLDVAAKSPTEWEWANTGVLQKATDAMDDFVKTDEFFQAFYLLGISNEFKAQYKNDTHNMMVKFRSWNELGEPLCAAVSKNTARLLAMSAASKKADNATAAPHTK